MKASCNCSYKKNGKEEIKEKLGRSASNERRRCPGSVWYSQKTGFLNVGKAKSSIFPPKKSIKNLNLEEKKKKNAEKRCFRHPELENKAEKQIPHTLPHLFMHIVCQFHPSIVFQKLSYHNNWLLMFTLTSSAGQTSGRCITQLATDECQP